MKILKKTSNAPLGIKFAQLKYYINHEYTLRDSPFTLGGYGLIVQGLVRSAYVAYSRSI